MDTAMFRKQESKRSRGTRTRNQVNNSWTGYERSIGATQVSMYGVIYLNDMGTPIDDFEYLDDINEINER